MKEEIQKKFEELKEAMADHYHNMILDELEDLGIERDEDLISDEGFGENLHYILENFKPNFSDDGQSFFDDLEDYLESLAKETAESIKKEIDFSEDQEF